MTKVKAVNKIDILVAGIYCSFGCIIWLSYRFSLLPQETINNLLLALTFLGPLSIFSIYYHRFRILSVTVFWLILGVAQWVLVYPLQKNRDFDSVVGSWAENDINLLVAVVLIILFRMISIFLTKREFIVTAWFGPEQHKPKTTLDYVLSLTGGFVLLIGLDL